MPAISFLPFLQGVPASTRVLTALLVLFTAAAFGLETLARENTPSKGPTGLELPWLVMVPGKSLIYPWTVLTAGLVELNIFEVSLLRWAFQLETLDVQYSQDGSAQAGGRAACETKSSTYYVTEMLESIRAFVSSLSGLLLRLVVVILFLTLADPQFIFSIITLVFATRYLDRIWGFVETLRFSAVVIVGSNIIALGFSWIVYTVTGSQDAL
jgi:hypothetical protein